MEHDSDSVKSATMTVEILLLQRVHATITGVHWIVAENGDSDFDLLPHSADCGAALAPGILACVTDAGESWFALDHGTLVKTGLGVRVSARAIQAGPDLASLHTAVAGQHLSIDVCEHAVLCATGQLEAGFVHAFGTQHA